MIRWVFWDLGDTLLNEDPLRCRLWERLHDELARSGETITFNDLTDQRERLAARGDSSPHYTIARDHLHADALAEWETWARTFPAGDGQQLVLPIDGAELVLAATGANARQGIIADQPAAVLDTLERLGMRSHFDIVALSESVGVNKPDPEIYREALRRAECSPAECVMIGNRLDTDCAPARRVGMRSVFCYLPADTKGWRPSADRERAYLDSLARTPNWRVLPRDEWETPDAMVYDLREIDAILAHWSD